MNSKIDLELIRETGKKGFLISGSVRGTPEDLISIIAYSICELARIVDVEPPQMLLAVVHIVKELDLSGQCKGTQGIIKGEIVDASGLKTALDILKKEGEHGNGKE